MSQVPPHPRIPEAGQTLRLLVWSTSFHRAGFELATLSSSKGDILNPMLSFQFGSNIPPLCRLVSLVKLTLGILARNPRVFAPDSDCAITRYLATLMLLLRRQNRLYLLPDGYITTKPLRFRCSHVFPRPVTADSVIKYLNQHRSPSTSRSGTFSNSVLVSLKRPQGMSLSDAKCLARTMLSHAVRRVIDSTGSNDDIRHRSIRNSRATPVWVVCHRSIPHDSLPKIFREVQQECSHSSLPNVDLDLLQYSEICLQDVSILYSLPSTVIWEVWQANPAATLVLFDPTKANVMSEGRWRTDLVDSLLSTRKLASSRHYHCESTLTDVNFVTVESWKSNESG